MQQTWNTETYSRNARFVSDYGVALLDLLAPVSGERILDLGCGDGVLTQKIAAAGVDVVGVDASENFVVTARSLGLDARLMDAHHLPFQNEFDAVFSNAALHWMLQPDLVIAGVERALKPGGRFVGEMGGFGNVASIATALRAVFHRRELDLPHVWYYPTPDEYSGKLLAAGLQVQSIGLIPRPTPLPTGMVGWLETFRNPLLSGRSPEEARSITDEVVELLRPSLCDRGGNWTADYVRLRFVAIKPAA
ncbi:MAG: methyltransferase domain-containing protein [Bryobacteraceae bacterium]|nr:methyltransferase domain-containing protein [Bryobacteraceae bacterium]